MARPETFYVKLKARRDMLRAQRRCINGPARGSVGPRSGIEHGPVVQGGKCARCVEVWRKSA